MSLPVRHGFDPGPQLERLAFFSDAVFAIALTLLVLDIRLPDLAGQPGGPPPLDVLRNLAPRLTSFVLSFLVVGSYWVGHHRIFGTVRDYNGRVIALNFLLLLFVVFIPFPTAFLSTYGDDPAGPVLYALAIGGGALTEAVLWMYLAHVRFLDPRLPPRYVAYRLSTYLRVPIVFLASLPIAIFVSPFLAEYSWALVLLIGMILRRAYRDVADLRPEHDEQPEA